MTEDEAFTNPPDQISALEFYGSDTVKCLTIHASGDYPMHHEIRLYHLPGHWSAVYLMPAPFMGIRRSGLVKAWDWTDEHYLEAMQFALDLHKLEIWSINTGGSLDPYDWMTPEEHDAYTDMVAEARQARREERED